MRPRLARLLMPSGARLTPELEPAFRRDYFKDSLPAVRTGLALAFLLYALFGLLDPFIVPEVAGTIAWIRYAIACPLIALVFAATFHRDFERVMQPALTLLAISLGVGILVMIGVADATGGASYYAGLMLVIVWGYLLLRLRFVPATLVGWVLVGAYACVATLVAPVPNVMLANNLFFFVSTNVIGMLGSFYLDQSFQQAWLERRAVEVERARAEDLLLNILPASIAARLKVDGKRIADGFEEVTVLFADIVDFTPMSQLVPPLEMVHLLNDIFSALDTEVERLGLEKIKTIGDACMAVGGIPLPRGDHAEAVADLALAIREIAARFRHADGTPVRVRIGINTGPVVAGVIGRKKFIYDLWGDAVNTASRMESHGLAGEIQLSAATRACLPDRYVLESRGVMEIKGKGPMETWILRGVTAPGERTSRAPGP